MSTEFQLEKLLRYCGRQVPFYQELGLANIKGEALSVLRDLTPLTKQSIRKDPLRLVSTELTASEHAKQILRHALTDESNLENETALDLGEGVVFLEKTSGSSGTSLKMIKTMSERMRAGKVAWKLRRQIDSEVSPLNMFPFEHSPRNFSFPYDLSDYTEENIGNILAEIGKRGYLWLHGHPQGLRWWAEAVLNNRDLSELVSFRYIESNGSSLSPECRGEIERAFRCPVIDNYNCREVWTVAYECSYQRLHVNDELIVTEILDDDGGVITEPDMPGRLFVTSLYCFAMPFVRYQLGDLVEYSSEECDCGNQARTFCVIPGRPNGRIAGQATQFGADVFSKVTRFIYDSSGCQYSQIRVHQLEPQTFAVYISNFIGDRTTFATLFSRVTNALLEPLEVQLEFNYVSENDPVFLSNPRDLFVSECAEARYWV